MAGLKQKLPIKPLMIGYLGVALVWGAYQTENASYLFNGLGIVAAYLSIDLFWTYVRDKIWYIPLSSIISGLIIALIGAADPNPILIILMAAIAVASKQIIKLGSGSRHIFNPAALSLITMSVFGHGPTWWGVAWGTSVLHVVFIAGLFIWWRQSRFETAISFFVSYAVSLGLIFLWHAKPLSELVALLTPQLYDGTVIFFASVMLVEPMTSGFQGKNNRIIYGIVVGITASLVSLFANFLPYDPLLLGLLFGNLIISLKTK